MKKKHKRDFQRNWGLGMGFGTRERSFEENSEGEEVEKKVRRSSKFDQLSKSSIDGKVIKIYHLNLFLISFCP